MNIKYTETPMIKCAGIVWFFCTLMNVAGTLFLLVPLRSISVFSILFIINGMLAGTLCYFYMNLKNTDYICTDDEGFLVHKNMIFKPRRIDFKEIETIREINEKVRIQEKNGKEILIQFELMELKGIKILREILKERVPDKYIE